MLALAAATAPLDASGAPNAPLAAWLVEHTGGGACWWRRALGVECAGCGLTRGFVQLAHGHLLAAARLNPLAPALFLWTAWRALETGALVLLRRRLRHGVPDAWVWRYYGALALGFVALAALRPFGLLTAG